MIFVVDAANRKLFEADLAQMHRQRKIIFVDRIGWKIPVVSDMEIDRYDHEGTLYLLAKDQPHCDVRASVRLLPTDGPHLMSDLFADVCHSGPPRGPAIWEVSRFCTAPSVVERRTRLRLLWEVTCGVIEIALLCGISQVIFAANSALLPLMLNCGWDAKALGPTRADGKDRVTAVAAQISSDALRRVRQRHRVPVPALRFEAGVQMTRLPLPTGSTRDNVSALRRVVDRHAPLAV